MSYFPSVGNVNRLLLRIHPPSTPFPPILRFRRGRRWIGWEGREKKEKERKELQSGCVLTSLPVAPPVEEEKKKWDIQGSEVYNLTSCSLIQGYLLIVAGN